MKFVNSNVGKIGVVYIGPFQFLNEDIRLGEAAICIARDNNHRQPCVWLLGATEIIIDYISLARSEGEISDMDANMLLANLDRAVKDKPYSALARLAHLLGVDANDLEDQFKLAQVNISSPITGVQDFTTGKPILINKSGYCFSRPDPTSTAGKFVANSSH